MESIFKSDIFFVIASIATVILAVIFVVAGYYIYKIFRNVEDISEKMKEITHKVGDEIEDFRLNRILHIFSRNKKGKKDGKA